MILRDLVSRFSFETDRRGIEEFNTALGGMRKSIATVAGAFGVGLGIKSMVELGLGMEQARFQARRFGAQITDEGEFIGDLGEKIRALRAELRNFTRADTLNLFVDFRKQFEGFDRVERRFSEFVRDTALIARAGQRQFGEVAGEMLRAATTGNFEFLKELPGVTAETIGLLEKEFGLVREAFFIPQGQIPQFVSRLLDLLGAPEVQSKLRKDAAASGDTVVSGIDSALLRFKESAQRIATAVLPILQPLLDVVNGFFDRINADGGTAQEMITRIAQEIGLIPEHLNAANIEWDALTLKLKRFAVGAAAGAAAGAIFGRPVIGAAIGGAWALGATALRDELLKTDFGKAILEQLRDAMKGQEAPPRGPRELRTVPVPAPGGEGTGALPAQPEPAPGGEGTGALPAQPEPVARRERRDEFWFERQRQLRGDAKVSTTISVGPVVVNTQAKDAEGIAAEIGSAIDAEFRRLLGNAATAFASSEVG